MKNTYVQIITYFLILIFIIGLVWVISVQTSSDQSKEQVAQVAAIVSSPFHYNFSVPGTLNETGKMDESSSPYWWLNSGGKFYLENGTGRTIYGELEKGDYWRLAYNKSTPTDTDEGYHPQNIFRLLTRSRWLDFEQEIYFRITKINTSRSINRDESNGVLLINRYQDGDNLYYAGVRVDGTAVIKKKKSGTYFTLAQKQIYQAEAPYNRDTNPNLMPGQTWIGLKSRILNDSDGSVSIKVYIDKNKSGNWQLATQARDDGISFGGEVFRDEGYAGIRTDFMDVEFSNFKIVDL